MRFRAAIVSICVCALLASCGEERRSGEQEDMIAPARGKGADMWLRATDHTEPALWLARREAGDAVAEGDPAAARIGAALRAARIHFQETDRMLANRTAQLGEMLAADGHAEDFVQLISSLAGVAATAGQQQTYGELCQHYYNLRHAGIERDAALQMLASRYVTQRQFR